MLVWSGLFIPTLLWWIGQYPGHVDKDQLLLIESGLRGEFTPWLSVLHGVVLTIWWRVAGNLPLLMLLQGAWAAGVLAWIVSMLWPVSVSARVALCVGLAWTALSIPYHAGVLFLSQDTSSALLRLLLAGLFVHRWRAAPRCAKASVRWSVCVAGVVCVIAERFRVTPRRADFSWWNTATNSARRATLPGPQGGPLGFVWNFLPHLACVLCFAWSVRTRNIAGLVACIPLATAPAFFFFAPECQMKYVLDFVLLAPILPALWLAGRSNLTLSPTRTPAPRSPR